MILHAVHMCTHVWGTTAVSGPVKVVPLIHDPDYLRRPFMGIHPPAPGFKRDREVGEAPL